MLLYALVAFPPIRDYDYGFHLATGRWIAQHGEVPRTDVFSYSARGARYVDAHWLFQRALHALHGAAGHGANRVAAGLCVLALLGVVAARGRARSAGAWTIVGAGLLLVALAPRILVRPEIVSFPLLAAVIALLQRHDERGGNAVLAVVPLQLLWANVHGLFAVGLACAACAAVAELLRVRASGEPLRRGHLARLLFVLGASAASALLNPNGVDAALQPLQQLGMIGPAGERSVFGVAIAELQPTLAAGASALGPLPLGATALLVVLAVLGLAGARPGERAQGAVLLAVFGGVALTAVRNVPLLAIVAALVLVRHAGATASAPGVLRGALRATAVLAALLLASVAALLGLGHWRLRDGPRMASSPHLADFHFPERAVDWIGRERPPGPLYHRLGDGGWLMWRLGPEQPVLIDGRLEVYGPELYARLELLGDDPAAAFGRMDARWRFGSALVTYSLFPDLTLLGWLHAQPDWRLAWLDEVAAVFVRVGAGDDAGRFPPVDPTDPALFPPLDPAHAGHPLDTWRRRTRVRVWAALGHPRAALDLARETLALGPDPELAKLLPWLEDRAKRSAR